MREPSATLVLDTAVLISAAIGRSAPVLAEVAQLRLLVTTTRVVEEARRRVAIGLRRPEVLPIVERLMEDVTVVPADGLEPLQSESEDYLRDAVASRNGSVRDGHILALAWAAGADIWSADRDFAGTGIASWSTLNLVRALAGADT